MNVKKKARRVMSGLLTAVTVLSTVLSPAVAYASDDAGSVKKIPYYEEIKDQLDEDEVVTAKDYEIKVGDNFDVKSDYTGLTIQDDSKVKVTFQEAKDTDGNDFSTDYANSYKAVYYVEPQTTDHPTYQINRKIVVKEADQQKDSQSESSSDQDAGSSDETETEDSEAGSSTEETGDAKTESKTELTEKEFDAEIEATENQETVDPETGITLSEVMQEAVDQEVALADLEAGESITFDMPMMLASGETGTKSVTVTAGSWYYYADYGLGSYLTCPYYVKWGSINATAYCVEPSKKGPGNGTYTIQKLADGKTLAKVCYYGTEIEVECQGEIFKAKGRTVLQDGWKLFENCFKNKDRMAIVDPDQEMKERMPKVTQGQTFYAVAAEKTEHFTSPPKPYSEDTLLAAMETAGNKEFDEDTEKKGLGTPATRAGIIEKLIYSQYATRKGKQILPTDDGKVLVEILPDFLKSASMTAEWENQLLLMEHGEIAPEQFMTGIKNMLTMMLNGCDAISEEETRRFQTRESIGTCPVCGSLVYESKTNFYCSNHDCHFALWKDNRYLQSMEKTMDKKMAAELLKSGCVHVKDLYSRKKNMYFEADLHMDADETGRVNFSLSFPKKKPKNKSKKK